MGMTRLITPPQVADVHLAITRVKNSTRVTSHHYLFFKGVSLCRIKTD